MKALVWDGPRRAQVRDIPDPAAPPDGVVVGVTAAGICGSDVAGYAGHMANRRPPLVMGHEIEGVVLSAPSSRLDLVGRRVAINPLVPCGRCAFCSEDRENLCDARQMLGVSLPGGFAQRVAVPVDNLVVLSESMPSSAGALVEPLACVIHAMAALVGPGTDLLVLGAGSLGLLAIELARLRGMAWIGAVDIYPDRLRRASASGANATYVASDGCELQVRRDRPSGPSAVLDTVGAASTKQLSVSLVRTAGTVVLLGLRDDLTAFSANEIVRRELIVRGTFAYTRRDMSAAHDLLAANRIGWSNFTSMRPLSDGPRAFEELLGPAVNPKILLLP